MYRTRHSTLVACVLLLTSCSNSPNAEIGRVDGFSQVVKTITWLSDRRFAPADEPGVRAVLGAEARYVTRIPIQIEGTWTDDLVWNDVTGAHRIVFSRVRHATAPFTRFRFGGRFPSREAGLTAIASWLALVDSAGVGSRIAELRDSSAPVEYLMMRSGRRIRLTMTVHDNHGEWSAAIDIENGEAP